MSLNKLYISKIDYGSDKKITIDFRCPICGDEQSKRFVFQEMTNFSAMPQNFDSNKAFEILIPSHLNQKSSTQCSGSGQKISLFLGAHGDAKVKRICLSTSALKPDWWDKKQ